MTDPWPKNKTIALNDLFWTLQGEGRWMGHRALFVRLPFCNYNCSWCDTEYDSFSPWTQKDFQEFCQQEPARFAVITGGEPLVHKDLPLILETLKKMNFKIACETNGSAPIPDLIDFPTVSPKAFTQKKFPEFYIHEQAFTKAKEFKYVVDKDFDFKILKRHQPFQDHITYTLSPEYSQMQSMSLKIIDYIKENPSWNLSLQTHKWLNIP